MRTIGATIKELAGKKGISLEKLAVKAGITNPTLHSIINKNDAKVSQLISLSDVLEVPVSYFFSTEGDSNNISGVNQSGVHNQLANSVKGGMHQYGSAFNNLKECEKELEKAHLEIVYLKRENDLLRSLTQK